MTEAEFRRAVRLGHGRALQFAERVQPMPHRQVLLDACTECQTYDPQIDGTLAGFTFELICASGEREIYRDFVLQSLSSSGDDWHAVKRFCLAALFVDEGDQEVRQAMYDQFRPGPRHGDGIANCFPHIDGLRGILFAPRKIGSALREHASNWDFGWFISGTRDFGEDVVRSVLHEAAQKDEDIARFLAHAAKCEVTRHKARDQPVTLEDLRARMIEDRECVNYGAARLWGKRATDAELLKAAHALLSTQDDGQQLWLLAIFADRPFPLDPLSLIPLAESDEYRMAFRATRILSHVQHPVIRDLAFRLHPRRSDLTVNLLIKNPHLGDHELILRWLRESTDHDALHNLGREAGDFWEANPDPSTVQSMLLHLYEHNPCMFCRWSAVRKMTKLNCLPDEVAEECKYDGNEDIRELVADNSPHRCGQ